MLHVALQEGFSDDTVVIRLDGAEVFRKPHVHTRLQIGLADSFETDVPDAPVRLEVFVPSKELAAATEVRSQGTMYVGVSVEPGGGLSFRTSTEPFGYV